MKRKQMDKWTIENINVAVNETRENGVIHCNFYNNTQIELDNLNKYLFKERPDLILRFQAKNSDELSLLPHLKNIKKLSMFGYESLNQLKDMNHLTYLEIYNVNKKALDIDFLEELIHLNDLRLTAKVKNLEVIGKCRNLEKLYLSTTITNYNFMQSLNEIKVMYIDYCSASNDFSLLNKPTLKELSITSINNLENIDTLKYFSGLQKLRLSSSKLKRLPNMSKLVNLRELELVGLKIWENPEIIKTIPLLEKLELAEINTKLDAEQFYFLAAIKTLKEIDFRFIDFNKKRIDRLNKWFAEKGKENIVIKNET